MAKKPRVEKDNTERYLVPYADLLTLMLAFFVVLYAMGSPDQEKMESLGDSFASAFNITLESQPVGFEKQNHIRQKRVATTDEDVDQMKAISEQNNLRELKRKIDTKIKEEGLDVEVKTNLVADGLHIVLTNEVLFDSASAKLTNEKSKALIREIGIILKDIQNPISIEGHTDNIPIKSEEFDSNWELSASRALTILKEMTNGKVGVNPGNYSATGFAEYKPLVKNDTKENKAKNRRVEIIVKRLSGENLLTPEKGGE